MESASGREIYIECALVNCWQFVDVSWQIYRLIVTAEDPRYFFWPNAMDNKASEWNIMPIEEIKAAYSEGTITMISRIHAFNTRYLAT
jgi:hypothetical protein